MGTAGTPAERDAVGWVEIEMTRGLVHNASIRVE